MYQRFHNRFGTAGVIIAVVALVAALSGTALAASGALSGKQKKEVEKIAKKYAGKPGAPGSAGTNGTNGTNGKDGAEGKQGPEGKDGTNGTGANGASVVEVEEGPSVCSGKGGVVYEVAGSGTENSVCNGEKGADGEPGVIHPEETLPPGATETGTWTVSGNGRISASLAFPIPMAANVETVHFKEVGGPVDPLCTGKPNIPAAAPGVLCVYYPAPVNGTGPPFVNPPDNPVPDNTFNGTGRAGGILYWDLGSEPTPGELIPGNAVGSFAVTGCSEEPGVQFSCPGF